MRLLALVFSMLLAAMFPLADASGQQVDTRPVMVFIGSSSIAKWKTLESDFPDHRVIKHGVEGGLLLPRLIDMIDVDVVPSNPSVVVVYGGENDLWGDNGTARRSPDEVIAYLESVERKIHGRVPTARIVYISIKPSPERWAISRDIVITNFLIRVMTARDPRLRYVDIFVPMLDENVEPNAKLFTSDSLHMNEVGYKIWKDAVSKALK